MGGNKRHGGASLDSRLARFNNQALPQLSLKSEANSTPEPADPWTTPFELHRIHAIYSVVARTVGCLVELGPDRLSWLLEDGELAACLAELFFCCADAAGTDALLAESGIKVIAGAYFGDNDWGPPAVPAAERPEEALAAFLTVHFLLSGWAAAICLLPADCPSWKGGSYIDGVATRIAIMVTLPVFWDQVREPALDTLLRQQRPPRWAAAAALSAVGSLEDLLQRRFSDMDPPWLAQAVGLFSTCHTSWVLLGGEAGCLDGQQLSPARLEELSAQAAKRFAGLREEGWCREQACWRQPWMADTWAQLLALSLSAKYCSLIQRRQDSGEAAAIAHQMLSWLASSGLGAKLPEAIGGQLAAWPMFGAIVLRSLAPMYSHLLCCGSKAKEDLLDGVDTTEGLLLVPALLYLAMACHSDHDARPSSGSRGEAGAAAAGDPPAPAGSLLRMGLAFSWTAVAELASRELSRAQRGHLDQVMQLLEAVSRAEKASSDPPEQACRAAERLAGGREELLAEEAEEAAERERRAAATAKRAARKKAQREAKRAQQQQHDPQHPEGEAEPAAHPPDAPSVASGVPTPEGDAQQEEAAAGSRALEAGEPQRLEEEENERRRLAEELLRQEEAEAEAAAAQAARRAAKKKARRQQRRQQQPSEPASRLQAELEAERPLPAATSGRDGDGEAQQVPAQAQGEVAAASIASTPGSPGQEAALDDGTAPLDDWDAAPLDHWDAVVREVAAVMPASAPTAGGAASSSAPLAAAGEPPGGSSGGSDASGICQAEPHRALGSAGGVSEEVQQPESASTQQWLDEVHWEEHAPQQETSVPEEEISAPQHRQEHAPHLLEQELLQAARDVWRQQQELGQQQAQQGMGSQHVQQQQQQQQQQQWPSLRQQQHLPEVQPGVPYWPFGQDAASRPQAAPAVQPLPTSLASSLPGQHASLAAQRPFQLAAMAAPYPGAAALPHTPGLAQQAQHYQPRHAPPQMQPGPAAAHLSASAFPPLPSVHQPLHPGAASYHWRAQQPVYRPATAAAGPGAPPPLAPPAAPREPQQLSSGISLPPPPLGPARPDVPWAAASAVSREQPAAGGPQAWPPLGVLEARSAEPSAMPHEASTAAAAGVRPAAPAAAVAAAGSSSGHPRCRVECVLCLDAFPSCVLKPCRHLAMCSPCASGLWGQGTLANPMLCPVCREQVAELFHVFLP